MSRYSPANTKKRIMSTKLSPLSWFFFINNYMIGLFILTAIISAKELTLK